MAAENEEKKVSALLEAAADVGFIRAKGIIDGRLVDFERQLGITLTTAPLAPTGVTSAQIITPLHTVQTTPVAVRKKARRLTPEARQKISQAQKRRWDRQKTGA